jgi:uncharacterized protein with HEPN domain
VVSRASHDYLRDILAAIAAITAYTQDGRPAFEASAMLRDAVVARLIQIGQAVKDAQSEGLELQRLQPSVPWRSIAGMRDKLAHRYWAVDGAIVWAVVETELPKLEAAVRGILASRAPSGHPRRSKKSGRSGPLPR